ncbi:large conductance mechanosensitive channel protein MscL [Gryllotalpicola protaetiae]|uniref:Large-conductance mechanosensitive channel n=1 Tax=Gryllotalpicola protaetiae TaxID=2419771 RepID=A0A387BKD4_9MICO|nr:large conductance mechanosensitive channel protein MscL [Gryllotalpicola protaetiae]AYG02762.1 large conductance mechanosensitive channel protein MscL [Gryllotalpicola protaetiae]
MLKGFRDFIMRGNVIDLAVAVVIGAAFTAVVTAIVTGIINPLISAIFNAKSLDHALVVGIPTVSGGTSNLMFGTVIGAIISFLAVAAVVYFVMVMPMNHVKARLDARKQAGAPDEPPAPTDIELLAEIRDLLKAQAPTGAQNQPPQL